MEIDHSADESDTDYYSYPETGRPSNDEKPIPSSIIEDDDGFSIRLRYQPKYESREAKRKDREIQRLKRLERRDRKRSNDLFDILQQDSIESIFENSLISDQRLFNLHRRLERKEKQENHKEWYDQLDENESILSIYQTCEFGMKEIREVEQDYIHLFDIIHQQKLIEGSKTESLIAKISLKYSLWSHLFSYSIRESCKTDIEARNKIIRKALSYWIKHKFAHFNQKGLWLVDIPQHVLQKKLKFQTYEQLQSSHKKLIKQEKKIKKEQIKEQKKEEELEQRLALGEIIGEVSEKDKVKYEMMKDPTLGGARQQFQQIVSKALSEMFKIYPQDNPDNHKKQFDWIIPKVKCENYDKIVLFCELGYFHDKNDVSKEYELLPIRLIYKHEFDSNVTRNTFLQSMNFLENITWESLQTEQTPIQIKEGSKKFKKMMITS